MGGHVAIAQFLAPMMVVQLFDVENNGDTALHCATQEGQLSMVEYLVKSCGFDVQAKDKVGLLLHISWLPGPFSTSLGLLLDIV